MTTALLASSIVFILLSSFVIFFIIFYHKKQRINSFEKVRIKLQYEKDILRTQIEIQEQTLKTISQEIHDNVGQVLSLAKLNLGTFESASEAQEQKITDTKNLVSKAIIDLRNLSRSMYGEQLQELGLQEAIQNELRIVQNTGQLQTLLTSSGEPYKLQPQTEMVIFRMVQESIHNIIRHAKASSILVNLAYEKEIFSLLIADNGKGFDINRIPEGKAGMGLKSMQNRAALINGILEIDSTTGKGCTIKIQVPVNNIKQ